MLTSSARKWYILMIYPFAFQKCLKHQYDSHQVLALGEKTNAKKGSDCLKPLRWCLCLSLPNTLSVTPYWCSRSTILGIIPQST